MFYLLLLPSLLPRTGLLVPSPGPVCCGRVRLAIDGGERERNRGDLLLYFNCFNFKALAVD